MLPLSLIWQVIDGKPQNKFALDEQAMDKEYKARLNLLSKQHIGREAYVGGRRRYEIPVSQCRVQLLGRTIDLNFLVTRQLNQKLKQKLNLNLNQKLNLNLKLNLNQNLKLNLNRNRNQNQSQNRNQNQKWNLSRNQNQNLSQNRNQNQIYL